MVRKAQRILESAKAHDQLQREIALEATIARLRKESRDAQAKYKQATQTIERLETDLAFKTELQERQSVARFRRMAAKPHSESTAILPLNDWHVEELVEPLKVNGLNEYTLAIAEQRARRVFQKAVEMLDWLQSFARIRQLVVPIIGDLISGYIHPELIEVNQLAPSRAARFAQELLIEGLEFLLREKVGVTSILVPCVVGNHGRTTPKKHVATSAENSFETIMYENIEDRFRRESRVQFEIARGAQAIVELQGHVVRFTHGDDIRFQGGVGGLTIPANKTIDRWNKGLRAGYDFFGHWHQFHRDSRFVSCGCLIGVTPYGLNFGYEPPSQTLAVINRKNGLIFCEQIFVEDRVQSGVDAWRQARANAANAVASRN